MKGTCKR